MTDWTRLAAVAALIALAGCGGAFGGPSSTPSPEPTSIAANGTPGGAALESAETVDVRVTTVVDGDTVDVRMPDGSEETVRLVGIDAPEVRAENAPGEYEGVPATAAGVACLREAGRDASARVERRLAGASATLVFDPRTDRRGGYGRLLAYVVRDGRNVNYDLVETGHARVYDTDFALREAFDAAEERARASGRGLWTCRDP